MSPDINKVRAMALNAPSAEVAQVLAMIYLGDAIREGCSDIGPAIEKGLRNLSDETGATAMAITDIGREIASLPMGDR
jgi:hypothetical protein